MCLVLLTRKPITPFYVLNIADYGLPFTGVIGMSSVVPIEETGDCHLTYFPRYLDFADPWFDRDDEDLISLFLPAVKRLFPDLRDGDIASLHIHRARVVQPLQVIDYSRFVPKIESRHPGLFFLNTGQFANNTVHNNEVVKLVSRFVGSNAGALGETQVDTE
jgi:protoporphyrinogen oxidase